MKSFKDFASNIVVERVVKTGERSVNVISPQILPMQGGESGVSQAAVSKTNAEKIAQRALDKKKEEAIKKGYVNPEGRVQERGVVTNRIRAAALGYGDKGKDPTKYGINPAEVSKNKTTLFQRALSSSRPERRSARREIKKAVKSIETRYPGATERTATSFRGFSRSVGYTPSKSDISTLQRMARPETTSQAAARLSSQLGAGAGNRAQAAADAARDIVAEPQRQAQQALKRTSKKTTGFADLQKALDKNIVTPRPNPITKQQVQPRKRSTSVTSSNRTQAWQGPTKAQPVAPPKTPPTPTRAAVAGPVTSSSKDVAKQIGKEVRKTLSADRAATRAASTKAWTRAAKGLGVVGAGLEGKFAFDTAKASGASTKRALGAGIARAAGGLLGAAGGALAGSIAGPIGSIGGGTLGYTQGADKATKLYNRITGDPNKKVTTQSVIRNVGNVYREKVPTNIRAKVPEGVKKTFKDFLMKAGKQYGNWQRSQSRQEA